MLFPPIVADHIFNLQEEISKIDNWIGSYEGDDEELIGRRLDKQAEYIDEICKIRKHHVNW